MEHIGVIGRIGQTADAEDMHQDTGEHRPREQYQEGPVGIMGMFVVLLVFPDPSVHKEDQSESQSECGIISQQALGMPPGMDDIGLEPLQEYDDHGKQQYIPGHQQPVGDPIGAHLYFFFAELKAPVTLREPPLGKKMKNEFPELCKIQGKWNLYFILAPEYFYIHIDNIGY